MTKLEWCKANAPEALKGESDEAILELMCSTYEKFCVDEKGNENIAEVNVTENSVQRVTKPEPKDVKQVDASKFVRDNKRKTSIFGKKKSEQSTGSNKRNREFLQRKPDLIIRQVGYVKQADMQQKRNAEALMERIRQQGQDAAKITGQQYSENEMNIQMEQQRQLDMQMQLQMEQQRQIQMQMEQQRMMDMQTWNMF